MSFLDDRSHTHHDPLLVTALLTMAVHRSHQVFARSPVYLKTNGG